MSILLVEDDPAVRALVTEVLTEEGHEVRAVASAEAAFKLLAVEQFALVITDVNLPGLQGSELVALMRGRSMAAPIIVISGAPVTAAHVWGALGVAAYLLKPFAVEELTALVARVLHQAQGDD